ncbi:MAG: NHL repeat-containing protein, partial [Acidobacteria bacterium]|nr:NHL repeat-containing protein [Acidobacteriota bacterium]
MQIGTRLGRMLGLFVFGLASSFPLWAQSPGTIATVAGDGTAGNTAESGAATAAKLETAYGVVMDAQGNLYIADSWNHSIRKVAPGGTVSRSAGSNYEGTYGDGSTATYANLSYPRGLAIDAGGNLYIADSGNSKVRKISPDGIIRAFAGTGTDGYSGDGGAATAARLKFPRALAVDSAGNVYIADTWNYRVRKVTPGGTISTVAGDGTYGYSGDGTLATSASIGLIQALAVDPQDNLVLLDGYNHCLRKVTANGIITTIAGGSTAGYSGDGGPATAARFSYPRGLAIDFLGNIFVADSFNHRIRQIKPDGTISTLAGTGAAGYSGDNGPATAAQLNFPYGLAVSLRGDVFVTDLRNYRVRKVVMATAGAAPGISAGGVVNAATFKGPVSPGAIISIFGQGFATRASYAPSLPLTTSL